jgi:hypothetical protein
MGTYVASARGGTTAGSSVTMTITVPAGVTTAHTGLLCLAGANPTMPASFTITGTGITVATVYAPAVANNMWLAAYKITKAAAGTVLTITGNTSNLFAGAVHFFTNDFTAGPKGDRAGVSQAFLNVPTMVAASGSRCWVVASDRTSAATAISSATNPASTITQNYYNDPNVTNEGGTSFYLGEMIVPVAATNQSVVTWNGASGNAVGFHIAEVVTGGQPKVWDGTQWVRKPVKVWDGTQWVIKPVKVWDGNAWKIIA